MASGLGPKASRGETFHFLGRSVLQGAQWGTWDLGRAGFWIYFSDHSKHSMASGFPSMQKQFGGVSGILRFASTQLFRGYSSRVRKSPQNVYNLVHKKVPDAHCICAIEGLGDSPLRATRCPTTSYRPTC